MKDEFNLEIQIYKEYENKTREAIIAIIKHLTDNNVSLNVSQNEIISNLVNNLNKSINKLENLNSISLSNKLDSSDEISKRAGIIGDLKDNFKKLNNYIANKLIKNNRIVKLN